MGLWDDITSWVRPHDAIAGTTIANPNSYPGKIKALKTQVQSSTDLSDFDRQSLIQQLDTAASSATFSPTPEQSGLFDSLQNQFNTITKRSKDVAANYAAYAEQVQNAPGRRQTVITSGLASAIAPSGSGTSLITSGANR